MRSIRLVDNKEGEQIRAERDRKVKELKDILKGASVIDATFGESWCNDWPLKSLTLEKEGRVFLISIDATTFYNSVVSRLEVMDTRDNKVISEEGYL